MKTVNTNPASRGARALPIAAFAMCALAAVAVSHIQLAHFSTFDVITTFFVVLSLYGSVRVIEAAEEGRNIVGPTLLAGTAAGWAASIPTATSRASRCCWPSRWQQRRDSPSSAGADLPWAWFFCSAVCWAVPCRGWRRSR